MNPILSAGILGAIGGAVGGIAAWLLQKCFHRQLKWANVLPVFCAMVAAAASRAAQPSMHDRQMAKLDALPVVAAIKTYYPAEYATLRARVQALPSEASAIDAQNSLRPILANLVERQASKSSPENAYELFSLTRDEAKTIRAVDAASCVSMFENSTANLDLSKVLTSDQIARDQRVTTALLTQTALAPTAPALPLDQSTVEMLAMRALAAMQESDRIAFTSMGDRKPKTAEESRVSCDFYLEMFGNILSQPRAIAGSMIRSLLVTK